MKILNTDNTIAKNDVEKTKTEDFSSVLKSKLDEVNNKQIEADNATEKFIKGDIDVDKLMTTTEEAKMALQMAAQVRNKLVESYQEITRISL
jgi:flagellar hook-basal body complex protein FliE